jgi:hypothetical protein
MMANRLSALKYTAQPDPSCPHLVLPRFQFSAATSYVDLAQIARKSNHEMLDMLDNVFCICLTINSVSVRDVIAPAVFEEGDFSCRC